MRKAVLLGAVAVMLVFAGCEKKAPVKKSIIPEVSAVKLQLHSYRPSGVLIAEVKPFDEVNLVARVEGFLKKRLFTEGARVKKGALLFEIEPELYQAKVKAAQAKLTRAAVARNNAATDYKRQRQLLTTKAVSERTFDKVEAAKLEADADVKNAEAELEIAKQNLSYTRITAPFDGQIGLSNYSVGNLVNSGSGTLATVVRTDPMRVEFSVSELQLLNMLDHPGDRRKDLEFRLITQDGKVYPFPGEISFWDNKVNTSTGTFRIQAKFANPECRLTAGMFCRIMMRSKLPKKGLVIPDESVMMDQAGEYVYVIDPYGTVTRRNVRISYREKGMAVIASGVKAGEVVIDAGVQHVRPGGKARAVIHKFELPGSGKKSEKSSK